MKFCLFDNLSHKNLKILALVGSCYIALTIYYEWQNTKSLTTPHNTSNPIAKENENQESPFPQQAAIENNKDEAFLTTQKQSAFSSISIYQASFNMQRIEEFQWPNIEMLSLYTRWNDNTSSFQQNYENLKKSFSASPREREEARRNCTQNKLKSSEQQIPLGCLKYQLEKEIFSEYTKKSFAKTHIQKKLSTPQTQCKNIEKSLTTFLQLESQLPKTWEELKKHYQIIKACIEPTYYKAEYYHLRMGLLAIWKKDTKLAQEALLQALQAEIAPERARTLFWLGYISKPRGGKYWESLLMYEPFSLHALLLHRLTNEPFTTSNPPPIYVKLFQEPWSARETSNLLFSIFFSNKEKSLAEKVAKNITERIVENGDETTLARAIAHKMVDNYHESMRLAFRYLRNKSKDYYQDSVLKLAYPTNFAHYAQMCVEYSIEPALALGLMRQESSFRLNVKSPAGALGLMQVMPKTAAELMRRKLTPQNILDPKTNIKLGCMYLAKKIKWYNNDFVSMLASYNAGPGNVAKWKARYSGAQGLLFADLIPLAETRAYVSSILRSKIWYRYLEAKEQNANPKTLPSPQDIISSNEFLRLFPEGELTQWKRTQETQLALKAQNILIYQDITENIPDKDFYQEEL